MRCAAVRCAVATRHELFSRETLLLGNNVLLVAATLVVLLGTLLPLVHKQLGLGSISIGEPFFNTMFTYLMVPFALLLGVGPWCVGVEIRWAACARRCWLRWCSARRWRCCCRGCCRIALWP